MQENKFDPTQNINLMSNLLTLNLQLHKQVQSIVVIKKKKTI